MTEHNELLDSLLCENPQEEKKKRDQLLAKRRKLFLILLLSLTAINLGILKSGLIPTEKIFDERYVSIYSVFTFGIAIWGFVLGSLFSLIPFKKASYGKKYLMVSLLIMVIIDGIFFLEYLLLIALHRK